MPARIHAHEDCTAIPRRQGWEDVVQNAPAGDHVWEWKAQLAPSPRGVHVDTSRAALPLQLRELSW